GVLGQRSWPRHPGRAAGARVRPLREPHQRLASSRRRARPLDRALAGRIARRQRQHRIRRRLRHRRGLRVSARARGVMTNLAPAMPSARERVEALDVMLPDEQATGQLARELAAVVAPGDMITPAGALGSGKTTFARGLIRQLSGDDALEVPSPTFTLMQVYELQRGSIAHVDLYRVNSSDELVEMGFTDLGTDVIGLVEWPDRAADL